jgi:RNA polymerase sigma factor (sigma-70 family)
VYDSQVTVQTDERAVLEAARAGDASAFRALLERYQEPAYRVAYLFTRDAQSAEDVCQEAFVLAYRHLDRFRVGEPFRPWLLRIVSNQAKDHLRARGRRLGLLERVRRSPSSVASSPERGLIAAERGEAMRDAIQALSPDDREVIYLRYFLDLSEQEIAVAIGRRPGTVKSRLSRARGRLRAVIETRHPDLVEAMEDIDG